MWGAEVRPLEKDLRGLPSNGLGLAWERSCFIVIRAIGATTSDVFLSVSDANRLESSNKGSTKQPVVPKLFKTKFTQPVVIPNL